MSQSKITIETEVAAIDSKTWDYYTNPAHIINWNFASDEWCCPSAENDMQVGGKYLARMEANDGSFGFDFEGIYDEVIEGEQFTYTLEDGRIVNVVFKGQGDNTIVSVTFDPESENPIEMQRGGWQAILNNFKKYAEKV
jgi:uncharacterized protein YndB with AHSA1/START domain